MKKETKELVEFIKSAMNCVREEAVKQNAQSLWWFSTYDKAVEFLNSLPEIESRLCRGGYIQDKNGNLCCDGDKVKYDGESCTLFWSRLDSCFYVKRSNGHREIFYKDEIEKE